MLKHALGSTLLVSATQVLALSLGGTQGTAIIGRPMDVLVSSSVDAADAATGLCLEAEVLYGENQVPASAVTVAIHKLGGDGKGALRVRTTVPVNEPIVSLTLKAGCNSPFRRSYTLLADFDSAPVASPVVTTASRDVTAPVASGRMSAEASGADGTPGKKADRKPMPIVVTSSAVGTREPDLVPVLGPETPVRLDAPVKRPGGVLRMGSKTPVLTRSAGGEVTDVRQPVAPPAGARLQLEAIDLSSTNPAQSGTAGADSTLPAKSPDASSASAPVSPASDQALQQELKTLREEQERLRLAVEAMNSQLSQAQSGRYNNPLTYGLGLGVAGLLGAVLFLLRRQKQRQSADSWWNTSVLPVDSLPPEPSGANPVVGTLDDGLKGLEAVEAGASVFQEVPVSTVAPQLLLDLWEQVDFLSSIGQAGDALRLLEAFVQSHPRASEAPYLRWVQLASQTGNSTDLDKAQSVYEHHYHRLVPAGLASGAGLEGEGGFLQQLSQAWPGSLAKEQIDAVLFSQPGEGLSLSGPRSLKLFDDLLALRRLLNGLDTLAPESVASPAVFQSPAPVQNTSAQPPAAPEMPVATETDTAQWLSIGEPVEDTTQAPDMLALDLAPVPETAPEEPRAKAELPPLDFDFFEFDPKPGATGKKTS